VENASLSGPPVRVGIRTDDNSDCPATAESKRQGVTVTSLAMTQLQGQENQARNTIVSDEEILIDSDCDDEEEILVDSDSSATSIDIDDDSNDTEELEDSYSEEEIFIDSYDAEFFNNELPPIEFPIGSFFFSPQDHVSASNDGIFIFPTGCCHDVATQVVIVATVAISSSDGHTVPTAVLKKVQSEIVLFSGTLPDRYTVTYTARHSTGQVTVAERFLHVHTPIIFSKGSKFEDTQSRCAISNEEHFVFPEATWVSSSRAQCRVSVSIFAANGLPCTSVIRDSTGLVIGLKSNTKTGTYNLKFEASDGVERCAAERNIVVHIGELKATTIIEKMYRGMKGQKRALRYVEFQEFRKNLQGVQKSLFYITYVIVGIYMLFAVYICLIFGIKFDAEQQSAWISSMLMGTAMELFISVPAQIIILYMISKEVMAVCALMGLVALSVDCNYDLGLPISPCLNIQDMIGM